MRNKKWPIEMKVGLVIVGLFILWGGHWPLYCFFKYGTVFYTPEAHIELELIPPGQGGYLLGTDLFGRSLWEVISKGLIYSLGISLAVSIFSLFFGVIVGVLSECSHPRLQGVFSKLINLMFVLPGILVAIVFMSYFGNSVLVLVVSLILTNWAGHARITKGELKRILNLPYIESAQALGVPWPRLFWVHVFPFLLPQLLIHFILGLSGIVISEATLSFLGMSAGKFSWGQVLAMGKNVLLEAPFVTIIMSTLMGLFILGLNLLGDGLRDHLDPRN